MRKITHVTIGLLLSLTMLSACKKNITDGNAIGGSNYQQQLNNRSNLYKGNVGTGGIPLKTKVGKIIAADLKGALEGAVEGFKIGGKNGAIIGAIIGGAASSLSIATPLPDVDTSKLPFTRGNTLGSAFNPYNDVGYFHYQCINEAFASPANYKESNAYSNGRFYNFCSGYLSQQAALQPFQIQLFPLAASNSSLSLVRANGDTSLPLFLSSITKSKRVSVVVTDALKPYFECLELTVDVGDFITYSLDAEKIILLSTLSDFDKQTILATMSTARYGIQFWHNR